MSSSDPFPEALVATMLQSFYSHHWVDTTPQIFALGAAGGFSGARFWRIEAGEQTWCLRRWPKSDNDRRPHLVWTHQVLLNVYRNGCEFVPVPLQTRDGKTLISESGFLWQLEPWMKGEANYVRQPDLAKLTAAMTALANFHNATGTFARTRVSTPALQHRLAQIERWYQSGSSTSAFDNIYEHARRDGLLGQLADPLCRRFLAVAAPIRDQLQLLSGRSWRCQPVIGDIWHDHLLFTGTQLTGIVDFGTTKIDHISLDLARLIGSLAADNRKTWSTAMDEYHRIRPLSGDDRDLCEAYDRSGVLISGINWLQWICVEKRQMGQSAAIFQRVQRIADRMETIAQKM